MHDDTPFAKIAILERIIDHNLFTTTAGRTREKDIFRKILLNIQVVLPGSAGAPGWLPGRTTLLVLTAASARAEIISTGPRRYGAEFWSRWPLAGCQIRKRFTAMQEEAF
jgi:hypothetical protein